MDAALRAKREYWSDVWALMLMELYCGRPRRSDSARDPSEAWGWCVEEARKMAGEKFGKCE
jgi:hypothetical protein